MTASDDRTGRSPLYQDGGGQLGMPFSPPLDIIVSTCSKEAQRPPADAAPQAETAPK